MSSKRYSATIDTSEKVGCGKPVVEVKERCYKECRPATECRNVTITETVSKGEFECESKESSCHSSSEAETCKEKKHKEAPCEGKKKKKSAGWGILTWLIISLVIGIILWVVRPPLVVRFNEVDDESCINWWSLVLSSLVFGGLIVAFIWLIIAIANKNKKW